MGDGSEEEGREGPVAGYRAAGSRQGCVPVTSFEADKLEAAALSSATATRGGP